MMVLRQKLGGLGKNERGFTLPEVLITIAVMGIVFAIASASWNSVIESRRVDSATNQLASDLRLAHNKATNRLGDWAIVTPSNLGGVAVPGLVGPGDYYLVEVKSPITNSVATPRDLPDGTQIDAPFGALFRPDGSAEALAGSPTTITVGSNDGDPASGPEHDIQVNTNTSRIKVD